MNKGYEGVSLTVQAIGKLGLTGNIVPRAWYQWLRFDSGKVNGAAISILSELCYWYKPVEIEDPRTGRIVGWRKKFKGDKLQKSYQDLADSLGLTKRQSSDNVKWLESKGLLTTEFRHFPNASNVLYIDLCAGEIERISFSLPTTVNTEADRSYVETEDGLRCTVISSNGLTLDHPTAGRETYTEITTEITYRDYIPISGETAAAVCPATTIEPDQAELPLEIPLEIPSPDPSPTQNSNKGSEFFATKGKSVGASKRVQGKLPASQLWEMGKVTINGQTRDTQAMRPKALDRWEPALSEEQYEEIRVWWNERCKHPDLRLVACRKLGNDRKFWIDVTLQDDFEGDLTALQESFGRAIDYLILKGLAYQLDLRQFVINHKIAQYSERYLSEQEVVAKRAEAGTLKASDLPEAVQDALRQRSAAAQSEQLDVSASVRLEMDRLRQQPITADQLSKALAANPQGSKWHEELKAIWGVVQTLSHSQELIDELLTGIDIHRRGYAITPSAYGKSYAERFRAYQEWKIRQQYDPCQS